MSLEDVTKALFNTRLCEEEETELSDKEIDLYHFDEDNEEEYDDDDDEVELFYPDSDDVKRLQTVIERIQEAIDYLEADYGYGSYDYDNLMGAINTIYDYSLDLQERAADYYD